MNLNITTVRQRFLLTGLFLFSLPLLFNSCSSESFTQQVQDGQKEEQTLTFYNEENGIDVHYKVNFKDREIISVYRDGIKIPDNEIAKYDELIIDKLNYMRGDKDLYTHHKPFIYDFDSRKFKKEMEGMKEKFWHFDFKFDDKFKADMEKLKDELKDLDEIVIEIDRDKIKRNIDESLKHLDKLKIHKFNFDFDEDELNDNMKRITIEIEKNQDELDLNMDELEKEMEKLEDEMSELSEEMKDLDKDMKNLNKFLDAAKSELVKDGFIKSTDEEFEFELNANEMKVNGEKVSDELHSKYKEMYKEYFNKELEGKIKIKI